MTTNTVPHSTDRPQPDQRPQLPDLIRTLGGQLIATAENYFKLDHDQRREVARAVSDAALDLMPALLLLRDAEEAGR